MGGVDPCADTLPLGKVEIAINVLNLDGVDLAWCQPCFDVTEDPVGFTAEDACAKEKLGPQQVQFVAWLCAACVCGVEGEAVHGVRCL